MTWLGWLPLTAIVAATLALLLACASAMRQARIAQDALHDLSVDHARICTELVVLRADCRQLLGELELWQAGLYGEGAIPPEVRISASFQEALPVSQVDPAPISLPSRSGACIQAQRIGHPKDPSR